MKSRLAIAIFLAALFFPCTVFAQVAKIVDFGGKVMVKLDASGGWNKARLNMILNKDAEVETRENAYCTLAFDEEQKNIVTLKQNSRIKIDSIKPGVLYLPQGRVFSLIKNLAKNEKFQVRTPTAIAGARGTGWVTQYDGTCSSEKCFDDVIFIQGLDAQGNTSAETDLLRGNGMDVCGGGKLGPRYPLSDDDHKEWNDFQGYCDDLGGRGDGGDGEEGALQDTRDEQRDDLRDKYAEERHQDQEEGQDRYDDVAE